MAHLPRRFPDGAAIFDDGNGGWIHTVNNEVFLAGAAGMSAIHYDADGNIIDVPARASRSAQPQRSPSEPAWSAFAAAPGPDQPLAGYVVRAGG